MSAYLHLGSEESIGAAFTTAYSAHFKQQRKWGMEPYICHPIRVMHIIESEVIERVPDLAYSGILEATVLHDTLEDTSLTERHLSNIFHPKIVDLVKELTNPSSKLPLESPRAIKKEMDFKHIAKISNLAKIVKLADRYDNIRDIERVSVKYARKYLDESKTLLDICSLEISNAGHEALVKMLGNRISDKLDVISRKSAELV